MAITSKDERFVRIAKKLMGRSKHPKYKYCSLITSSSHIIGIGFNKTAKAKHFVRDLIPGQKHHSEIDAILWLDKETTRGKTLYCWGETNLGNPILSRPCQSCYNTLIRSGIKRIVYSDKLGSIQEEKLC